MEAVLELPDLSMTLRGLPKAASREALRPCEGTSLAERLEGLHARSFSWALGCCRGNREEALEVLQTAYLRVLDGRARFGGGAAFPTWLFGVIRRVAAGRRRRERLRRMLLLRFGERNGAATRQDDPSAPLLREEKVRRIRRALDRLSRRQREILELVFYHDLPLRLAAEVLGITEGAASVHYHRGKEKLRRFLEGEVRS